MQVSKWGNSLAVRLPRKLVQALRLAPGDELAIIEASKDRIAVEKRDRRKEALDRMRKRGWTSPKGYRFDREDANKR
jgi:antitoxin MazE